ncbi:hypothetical protein HOV03_gp37 [Gordonia phage Asapag]|uniref:Uncharacterized protein n=3 Tax=Langleyhallvirinae TaxID=2732613 RepID=A0A385E1J2_9CAUD|nr:hypothetical protein HOT93_gp037 [Gordonia phage Horus]YP_009808378.1 hypothetical protein HOT94_gp037 [Gordonia phage Phistory]YP_009819082.1 hypothetical protein HOV03_gp37 [Gordonia phage Asapag]UTN91494.1 hypothetical protein SEA_PERIWINKLE_40 [Gordonia phage Periwinkle]AXQ63890.1 hypothetical protein SEA_HORUS_37 [Gordonia phage Horus]AXQ64742.1 hypothetical protein SEA_PHISTORY_37 [Gordonia phage Phistory]QAU07186.1 hypothetical protein SEA_ASAPAG_37 [Gordonia phage Asapag]
MGPVMNREVLRAASEAVHSLMRKQQANRQALTDGGWSPPDPELEALGVECDEVLYGRRAEAPDLADRLAAVLGDDWEP